MSSVDIEYAYKLASTLMWKRFGDEKPKHDKDLAIKRGEDNECFYSYYDRSGNFRTDRYTMLPAPDDLWLYLSDLDVLRVKG